MSQPKTIVLASGNPGKLREIAALVEDLQVELRPQGELKIADAVEDGLSFVENALIKARHAAKYGGFPAIADDSGIELDCLKGEPGIHSARYAGVNATDKDNLDLLLENIMDIDDEPITGRFQCVMVYMRHALDPVPLIAQASWEGQIIKEPRGKNGFGYDPVFYLPEYACTSAELSPEVKNSISHRGRALGKLVELLRSELWNS